MIRRFPREHAFLERTHLRFVNLNAVLTDSKVERAARVPSFVAVYLGDETELILLLQGDPVTAIRIGAAERRVLPIGAVVERAEAERERADIGYYAAPEAQLRAMFASVQPRLPPPKNAVFRSDNPARFFQLLREAAFTGVVELMAHDARHYALFRRGSPTEAFIEGAPPDLPRKDAVTRLFAENEILDAALYPPIEQLPAQAPQALVEVYARTMTEALRVVQQKIGGEGGLRCFESALAQVREQHPALADYRLDGAGGVDGHSSAAAGPLTDAVGAWLFEALSAAQRSGGLDPSDVVGAIPRDRRYVLEAQGFFQRLPWAVAW